MTFKKLNKLSMKRMFMMCTAALSINRVFNVGVKECNLVPRFSRTPISNITHKFILIQQNAERSSRFYFVQWLRKSLTDHYWFMYAHSDNRLIDCRWLEHRATCSLRRVMVDGLTIQPPTIEQHTHSDNQCLAWTFLTTHDTHW